MTNVAKYFLALESINLEPDDKNDSSRIRKNLKILEKCIESDVFIDVISQAKSEESEEQEWNYCLYMYQVILSIIDANNFESDTKEDLLSTRHLNLLTNCIQDVSVYGLRAHLHTVFRSERVFGQLFIASSPNIGHLITSVQVFRKILAIRQFQAGRALNEVIRDYIAGILTILESGLNKEIKLTEAEEKVYQSDLNSIWKETSKCDYFQSILLFKGMPNLPPALQKRLHIELLNKLMWRGGFTSIVGTLLTKRINSDVPECEYFEVIANIVAHKGHSMKFHNNLIQQIFEFLHLCISNPNKGAFIGAGLLTLKRLYELKDETRNAIAEKVSQLFQKLAKPEDVISGLISMDYFEFAYLWKFIFNCFCTSSVECLPSELLTKYLPLLLNVYSCLTSDVQEKIHIRGAIVRCLSNRSRTELDKIINSLVSKQYPDEWVDLHPRVSIRPIGDSTKATIKITSADDQMEALSISDVLPELLISSNHNILTYTVFMCLLGMMQEVLLEDDDASQVHIDLLHSEEELLTFLNTRYPVKVEIILCLSALVTHPNLKAQITENSSEFLDLLRTFIQRRSSQSSSNQESTDHTLLLMLTITQEMIENSKIPEKYRDFSIVLRELRKRTPNELIVHRIDKLLLLLEGGLKASFENKTSQYNMARDLMKGQEAHLKVYGINLMIEMLRRGDKDALANRHVTLALALHALKEPESYTFLNCVRLLVELVNVMEREVMETLSDEYLNKDNQMDYRLVVGETILKVSRVLGQLSYKYKDVLLNCFMHGCRSENDEFRWSSFSNLALLCRTLTFEVDKFFHEMLLLIENELQTGTYLPAKRAAVLVLTEHLLGIDSLIDCGDQLLPIFRVLKTLSTDSDDEKIRIHAANGLKAIKDKLGDMFSPLEKREKEIKIFGINGPTNKKSNANILEII